ncbi:MAG: aldehyde dehydrogenase family protein [Steroidobacteraceae bacterium]|nr:aldehyde dehydrogenase family protein [Steroidobacteraceae bacterium]
MRFQDRRSFYLDGRWMPPQVPRDLEVVNPASEQPIGVVSVGDAPDVDLAVRAARRAFPSWSAVPLKERLDVLIRLLAAYEARQAELAAVVSAEMGAPITMAKRSQVPAAVSHIKTMIDLLPNFEFRRRQGRILLRYEPIGVCGLITPWNWPMNQIACKVVPALAAGCSMILKPSELAPLSASIWTEVMHEAGVPAGVFNLVHGDGSTTGAALAAHPGVDMVSFTGSTRGGVAVAQAAAPTVKRVHQELGGKSPCILLDDAAMAQAVLVTVTGVMSNSGQSCTASSRVLVPSSRLEEVESLAATFTAGLRIGDPADPATQIGPVVSSGQFDRIQSYIESGIAAGAKLLCGGLGRPEGSKHGWFVRPTVFSRVSNDMKIAREEIFGPVVCLMPYRDLEQAVEIANDTPYGLAAYVWSADPARAYEVACRVRAGVVQINGATLDRAAPFGGVKQSGNGREWGLFGLHEYLEVKALAGCELAD